MPEITELLKSWSNGDRTALDQLIPLVYADLKDIAHRRLLREQQGHTLQTTALVNEVYLKLVKEREMQWQNRAHFFAVAAQLIRNILVDYARTKNYAKRGGGAVHVPLDEALILTDERLSDVVALDDALQALAAFDARKSKVAELRFFAGLSVEETAEVLKISPETVTRDWRVAKAWLRNELSKEEPK